MKFFFKVQFIIVSMLSFVFIITNIEIDAEISQNTDGVFISDNFNVPISDEVFLKSWISDVGTKYATGDLVYHEHKTYKVVQDFIATGDSDVINDSDFFDVYSFYVNTTFVEPKEVLVEEELVDTTINDVNQMDTIANEKEFIETVPFMEVGDNVTVSNNSIIKLFLCTANKSMGDCKVHREVVDSTRYNYGDNKESNKKNLGLHKDFSRSVKDSFCFNKRKTYLAKVKLAYGEVFVPSYRAGQSSNGCITVENAIKDSYTDVFNYSDLITKKIRNIWFKVDGTYSHTTYTIVTLVVDHNYEAEVSNLEFPE